MGSNSHAPCGLVNCKVVGPQGPSLTNRMSELLTYGSVGGVGGNPGPYPAPNRRPHFAFAMSCKFDYPFCAPPASPAAAGEPRRSAARERMKSLHLAIKLILFAILLSGCSTPSQKQIPKAAASEKAEREAMKIFERGQSDARKDIVKRRLVVVGWQVNPYGRAFAVLIHDKYGIELREMPKSPRNAITQQYVYGYND